MADRRRVMVDRRRVMADRRRVTVDRRLTKIGGRCAMAQTACNGRRGHEMGNSSRLRAARGRGRRGVTDE